MSPHHSAACPTSPAPVSARAWHRSARPASSSAAKTATITIPHLHRKTVMALSPYLLSPLLLILSNIFMTFAGYKK